AGRRAVGASPLGPGIEARVRGVSLPGRRVTADGLRVRVSMTALAKTLRIPYKSHRVVSGRGSGRRDPARTRVIIHEGSHEHSTNPPGGGDPLCAADPAVARTRLRAGQPARA